LDDLKPTRTCSSTKARDREKKKRQRGTGSVFLRKDSNVWSYQIYVNGKRERGSTECRTKREAEAFVQRKLAEYSTGISAPSSSKVIVEQLMDDLLLRHKNDGNKSVEDDESRWSIHIQPFFGHLRATQVTSDLIERYINERKKERTRSKKPPENATINRELALLKAAFNYGAEKTPPKVLRTPYFRMLEERNVRKGFVKDAEYIKLAEATAKEETAKLRPWLRGMFESGWCYGWREDELRGLRVRQFDPMARTILLEPGETKNDVPRQTPPMDETIYQLICACTVDKSPDDLIFTRDDGKPIKDFRGAWWKACVAAGVGKFVCKECSEIVKEQICKSCGGRREYKGLLFHDLRRTGVRNMVRNGISEKVAMIISGHKTRSVFDRYNITSYDDLAKAGERIRDGRERIMQQAKEFDHRTATVNNERGSGDKGKDIN
jgi:integrase